MDATLMNRERDRIRESKKIPAGVVRFVGLCHERNSFAHSDMPPREILKKIRHIELRTTCIVIKTPAGFSFQSPEKLSRIPCAMKNGNDGKGTILDREVNTVRLESFQANALCPTANFAKHFRLRHRAFQRLDNFLGKLLSETWVLSFIPNNCFKKFGFRFGFEDKLKIHHQPKRCFISALTCSQGIPSWGFFSKSARRRSSSAICSGVNSGSIQPSSSPYSSQTFSTNARFSSVGIDRICSIKSVALTVSNLSVTNYFASA